MFENISGNTILFYILSFLASRYIVPWLLRSNSVKKLIKVVDSTTDVVESDPDFNWETAPLTKHRPFKPVYHLTMGITKSAESQWLMMENTYLRTVEYHRKIAAAEPTETCIATTQPQVSLKVEKATKNAVAELYNVAIAYMRTKYPAYFVTTGKEVTNMVTQETIPRNAPSRNIDAVDLLRKLCTNIEEDFLILQMDDEAGEYVMRAATGVGANGYRNTHKLNQKLTKIHMPVPQYVQKLQLSMNRHFARIKAGEYIQRLTWGIQVGGGVENVFKPSGIHLRPNAPVEELKPGEHDVENDVFLRVERQVLTRLPKSQFLVLTIRTYMYPLKDIKEEGNAKKLATAIRGWPEDMAHYKGRSRWGRIVLDYLDEAAKEKENLEGAPAFISKTE